MRHCSFNTLHVYLIVMCIAEKGAELKGFTLPAPTVRKIPWPFMGTAFASADAIPDERKCVPANELWAGKLVASAQELVDAVRSVHGTKSGSQTDYRGMRKPNIGKNAEMLCHCRKKC